MGTLVLIGGALLAGAVLGAAGAMLLARRDRGDSEKLELLRSELDGYKQNVSEHFVQTAELVNELTRSYKAVFDHLEQGAYRLVGEEALRRQLANVDAEPVKLEYIGSRDRELVLGVASDGSGAKAPVTGEVAAEEQDRSARYPGEGGTTTGD
jgi:uncharacterized membrane-anchored protein YhcB (DUF1043 family)